MIRLHGTVYNSELHCVRKFKTGINLMSFYVEVDLQETCMNISHFFLQNMVRHENVMYQKGALKNVIRRQYIKQIIFLDNLPNI